MTGYGADFQAPTDRQEPKPEEDRMKPENHDKDRRTFLRGALVTGVAAATATTSLHTAADLAPKDAGTPLQEETGYRLTEHVKAYYESFTR